MYGWIFTTWSWTRGGHPRPARGSAALQQGVRSLLYLYSGARLHIQTLLRYDGKGRCDAVQCIGAAWTIYRDQLKEWAARVDWEVRRDDDWGICLVRK